MKPSIYNRICTFLSALWMAFCGIALLVILLFRNRVDYYAKTEPALSAVVVMFLLAGILSAAYLRTGQKKKSTVQTPEIPQWIILPFSVALFVLQAVQQYNIFFLTNWDSSRIVYLATQIASPDYTGTVSSYLSMYPNNTLLTWLYACLFPMGTALGLHWAYFVILIQCVLSCIGGWMLFALAKQLFSVVGACCVWFVYAVHIALNPWLGVLYSDPITLCVPIGILYLYDLIQNGRHLPLKWSLIGMLAYVGYQLKPFSAIAAIAVLLVDLLQMLSQRNKQQLRRTLVGYAAMVLPVLVLAVTFGGFVFPSMKVTVDHEARLGAPHFLMMGLNSSTNGAWDINDVLFSVQQPDRAARDAANLHEATRRLQQMGLTGLTEHLRNKLLVSFADGTYAWGQEGDFYLHIPPEPNSTLAPFLRDVFYNQGRFYSIWEAFQNLIWYLLLFGSCIGGFIALRRKECSPTIIALFLSLLGISAYVMIFESRARYLFIYAPVFLLTAAYGVLPRWQQSNK